MPHKRIQFIEGDMRTWSAGSDFDLILIPASSITHVLGLEGQLAVWKACHDNLRPGGRLLVEVTMPNMASFADSFSVPPRTQSLLRPGWFASQRSRQSLRRVRHQPLLEPKEAPRCYET